MYQTTKNKKIMEEKQKYIAEIKKAMAEKKISNEKMAKIAGCSRVTIWRFFRSEERRVGKECRL